MEHTVYLLITVIISLHARTFGQKLDITAFEYTRKVKNKVELGHCVSKVEEMFPGTNLVKKCSLGPKSEPIRFVSKELNDTRNFEVQNYNDIFVCMGLCDGHASSVLGLLHEGDCFAVEIAGKLTFSKKTYIQAYVEYFRSGIDIQQTGYFPPLALRHYFDGNYFLHDRSYGTMEIIIVEMRFPKRKQVEALRRSRSQFQHISSFLQHSVSEVGTPSSLKIIRLSTAKEEFEVKHYKRNKFEDVFSKIRQYESEIFHIREDIRRNNIKPHLRYGMFPYAHTQLNPATTILPPVNPRSWPMMSDIVEGCFKGTSWLRTSDHIEWEEACVTEVNIDTALRRVKRLAKKCKKTPVEQCNNLSRIRKGLRKVKVGVHSKRSKWHLLDSSDKKKVKTANKDIRKFSKEISIIGKKLKEMSKIRRKKGSAKNKKRRKSKGKKSL